MTLYWLAPEDLFNTNADADADADYYSRACISKRRQADLLGVNDQGEALL